MSVSRVVGLALVLVSACSGLQEPAGHRYEKCPKVDPVGYTVMLPYPGDCGKFYMCSHGTAIPMNCPPGLYFNAKLSICDWPDSSGCVNPSWSCPDPDPKTPWRDTYPYPGNCSMYYLCWQGVATPMSCDAGLWFNANSSVCDVPADSGCVPPKWSCPPPSRQEPWRNSYAFPGDCRKFYTCVDGKAYERHCLSGLYFNVQTQQCDWDWASHCRNDTRV